MGGGIITNRDESVCVFIKKEIIMKKFLLMVAILACESASYSAACTLELRPGLTYDQAMQANYAGCVQNCNGTETWVVCPADFGDEVILQR